MKLKVAVQMDPIERINIGGDSTFALMLKAEERGYTLYHYLADQLSWRDGRVIADADLEHVRDTIWRHMIAEPWQTGDMVVIDNAAVSHGRLPYRGPRQVVVAWA